ncbi:DUF2274 domain-containing protein [Caulobacter flavus]|uniref:DUF2274 domain-containing protein n=1 Tax=Caulobacter flavus TaxID=1679497 RepID=A0A2N5CXA8_9CAUL|nr:DUF2274 domain-containing protein [Caulobacter flavus]AYV47545.1 DUF2274 domain-containing protein [Caulobacter flavus]PLR18386.1 DUF2274 domain-containing protein [Caulobacter flavus]
MSGKLKLGALEDDTPVKVTLDLPASVHRDLVAYAQMLATLTGGKPGEPAKLATRMLERFMATDRVFVRGRKGRAA